MVLIIPYANTIKDISSYINEFKFKRWITRESSCSTRKFIDLFLKENNINNYFGFTSFQKKEWTLIVNDIIQLYPELELI